MARPRQQLIDRREDLGYRREDVASKLRISPKTYTRWELGKTTPLVGQRPPLARLLEWSPAQLRVALFAARPELNGHAVPEWLGMFASFEQAAGHLSAFQAVAVHGLLQTPEYAYAVEQTENPPAEAVEKRVESRLVRQLVLHREPDPLELCVVLDESVLHRVAGSAAVMADQLDHLAEVAQWPNVDLRVLPLDAGAFVFGSFTLFTSPGSESPYMACISDRTGPHYLDRPHELQAHLVLFDHLSNLALPADRSVDAIVAVAKEYRS